MDIKENKHGLKGNSKNGKKYTCYKVSYHLLSKISIPWGPLYNNQLPLASPSRNSPRYTCTQVVVVQLLSHIWLFGTPWTAARQAPLSSTVFWSLLRFMSTESVMLSNRLILCHALLLCLVFPSIKVFSSGPAFGIRWPEYWSFSFSISPSNEYSRLISFRIDWFDLLAVQGTLTSLLQHHKWKHQFSLRYVQLLHPYMTTEKTTALTIWTSVSKLMSRLCLCKYGALGIFFLTKWEPIYFQWLCVLSKWA